MKGPAVHTPGAEPIGRNGTSVKPRPRPGSLMVKVGILQQKRAELCPPYLLHCRALRLKALGTTTVKSARVVGPTPWTQLPQQTGRLWELRPRLKQGGRRVRHLPCLVSLLLLLGPLLKSLLRFPWRPLFPTLLLGMVAVLVLAVALFPNLSPKPKAGRSQTLPRSPNSRSFSRPKPEKLARVATPP